MIHLLGKSSRHRTPNRRSTSMTRSAFRAFAALSVAFATLTPVATAPVVAAIVCPPGAVTWVAPGSGNWSDGANWSSGAMPTAGQNACVEDPTVTVTVNFNVAANQLVSAGTINIDQFWTLTLNGPSDIDRLTASGSLGGAGPVTITGAGSSWTSGTISTTLEIASTANIDIGGNTSKNLTGSLTNRGTVTQSGRSLRIGTVTNYGMWYLTYPSDATVIASSTVVPTFTNYGTVERSGTTAGALADIIRQVGFRNHGTINARTGELQISGFQVIGDGAVMHADGGAHFIMSAVNAAPGATVSGASTITGNGIVEWRSNTFALAAGAVVDARSGFLINGVNIAGPGKVSISGSASWQRGTVSGNLEVAPTGTLSFTHNASITKLYVTGNLTNNGTVLQADANLYVARAGVAGEITNNSLWQLTNVSSKSFMIRGEAATPGSFVNNGDLEGSAVATITGLHSTLNLRNNGTVAARSGQFWIRSAPTHYASPILTGGTWEARNGSALFFPTTFTENNATLILTGPGSFFAYLGGALSGWLSGLAYSGVPFIVIYLDSLKINRSRMTKMMHVSVLTFAAVQVAALTGTGHLPLPAAVRAAMSVLPALAGFVLGRRIRGLLSPALGYTVGLALLVAAAISLLVFGPGGWH